MFSVLSFQIRLYIDGKVVVPSSHDLEVVDDWPLHQSKKVLFTELVIGACWQGMELSPFSLTLSTLLSLAVPIIKLYQNNCHDVCYLIVLGFSESNYF